MNRFRLLGIAGLVSALVMIPMFAAAEAPPEAEIQDSASATEAPADGAERRRKRRRKRPKLNFPMEGAEFTAHVNKRLARIKSRIKSRLEKKNAPEAKKKKVLAKFSKHAVAMRAAARTAAADGQVSKEEAKRVRKLARSMRKKNKRRRGKRGRRNRSPKN